MNLYGVLKTITLLLVVKKTLYVERGTLCALPPGSNRVKSSILINVPVSNCKPCIMNQSYQSGDLSTNLTNITEIFRGKECGAWLCE